MPEGRTHGCGKKSRSFYWRWDGQTLHIHRENNWLHDEFPLAELAEILKSLEDQFGSGWFPLANNVEKVSKKTKKRLWYDDLQGSARCRHHARTDQQLPGRGVRGSRTGYVEQKVYRHRVASQRGGTNRGRTGYAPYAPGAADDRASTRQFDRTVGGSGRRLRAPPAAKGPRLLLGSGGRKREPQHGRRAERGRGAVARYL